MREAIDLARERDDFVVAVTSDHGEGLEPDTARVHHGGRVHQDLIQVPLWVDLPSSLPAERRDRLAERLASETVSSADLLPLLFEVAGKPGLRGDDGAPAEAARSRPLVSEDRRYLYLRDRFRLNWEGLNNNMSKADVRRNTRTLDQLDRAISLRSFLRFPDKLVVTTLAPKTPDRGTELPAPVRALCRQLQGAPVLLRHEDQVLALELTDLGSDPSEQVNLLSGTGWRADLLREPWLDGLTVLGPGMTERSLIEAVRLGEELALT